MLVVSRKRGEKLFLGNDIVLVVTEIRDGKVRLGIEAPQSVAIHREECHVREPQPPVIRRAPNGRRVKRAKIGGRR